MHDSFKSRCAKSRYLRTVFTALVLSGGWLQVHATGPSPTPRPVSTLGAHTLLVQSDGQGSSPAISSPVRTKETGSALLALVGGFASNAAAPTDNYANAWKQVGSAVIYHGYEDRFNAEAYVAFNAKGGGDHTLSVIKQGTAVGEITIPFIEIRNAGVLQDVAQNYPVPGLISRYADKLARTWQASGSGTGLTSASVTTTGPATLVAVWWGDGFVYRMTAVPNNGFKVIDSYLELPPNSAVQCAVASKQVAAAGTYNVTWTGTPAQGAILWLFAFQAG